MKLRNSLIVCLFLIFGLSQSGFSQKQVIIEGDALIHGSDSIPKNDSQTDSVFFFNRRNINLYSGLMKSGNMSIPQVDSFGLGGTGLGLDVYPMGDFSFAQGAGNYSRGLFSSTLGLGNINYSYGGTYIGILGDPIIGSTAVAPYGSMPLFNIGNGDPNFGIEQNAFTVFYDGKVEINQEYTLPNVDGTDGQVLSTDGNGNVSWENDGAIFESVGGVVKSKGPDTDDFVFGSSDLPPVGNYSDTLVFYDRSKGAFRVGRVLGSNRWEADSIGSFSFATGTNTIAKGDYSTALGYESKAIGLASMSWGDRSTANGTSSTAWGFGTQANGNLSTAWGGASNADGYSSTAWGSGNAVGRSSTAWGSGTNADGDYATAWGRFGDAIGDYSTTWGNSSQATGEYSTSWGVSEAIGDYSTSWGFFTDAVGEMSTTLGYYTIANTYAGVAIGQYNEGVSGDATAWVSTDPILEVGIGSSNSNRENAVTILKDGTVSFKEFTFPNVDGLDGHVLSTDGSGTITWKNDVGVFESLGDVVRSSGPNTDDFVFGSNALPTTGLTNESLYFFDNDKSAFRVGKIQGDDWSPDSIGQYSFAAGFNSLASGLNAISLGSFNEAIGDYSTSFGYRNKAIGEYSTSWGDRSEAIGSRSTAWGERNEATGSRSTAWGDVSEAMGENSTSWGKSTNAESQNSTAWGWGSIARGNGSTAWGISTMAAGDYSTSSGENTDANGYASTAMGFATSATGSQSVSMGFNNVAKGRQSVAMGEGTDASSLNSLAIGRYNEGFGSTLNWQPQDPILDIGIGTSDLDRTNAMTVLKNGKTGIGTSSPDEALSVVGTIRGALEEAETNFIEMGHGGNNAFINADGTGNIDIRHGDQNIMTLTPGKNVGFRTNNPQADIHLVHVNNSSAGGLRLENTSTNDYAKFYIASTDGHLRIYTDDQSGSVGNFNDVSGVYSATSDRRLKEDFEDLRFDWESFMKLQTLMYEYKSDEENKKHIGLIAQDVMKIYPEIISYDEDEDIYHMNYDAFGVISIKAIQEQQKIIQDQKASISDQEERIARLEVMVEKLTASVNIQSDIKE